MNDIIPWDEWVALIQPLYDKGNRGRLPRGIETMLRMYLVQIWFKMWTIVNKINKKIKTIRT